ncbi:hypothetical protein ACS0TY_020545 [Phlomoides rotata]
MNEIDLSRLYLLAGVVGLCLRYIRQIQVPESTQPRWRWITVTVSGGGGCAICLEEYKDGEKCAVVVTCNHRFHGGCIKAWLLGHDTCPLCRAFVV